MMEYHEHGQNKTKKKRKVLNINSDMTDYGKQSSIV